MQMKFAFIIEGYGELYNLIGKLQNEFEVLALIFIFFFV